MTPTHRTRHLIVEATQFNPTASDIHEVTLLHFGVTCGEDERGTFWFQVGQRRTQLFPMDWIVTTETGNSGRHHFVVPAAVFEMLFWQVMP